MKKPFFKTLCLILAFTHLAVVCFRDAAFAEEASSPKGAAPAIAKEDLIGSDAKGSFGSTPNPLPLSPSVTAADSAPLPEKVIKSFYLDPYSGSPAISIPLSTPPGRKGIQPNLTLTYSPSNGNGPFGFGWRMDFGSIERSTKNGVPKYGSQDKFIYSLGGGSSELIPVGNNEYRSKIESGFMRFKLVQTHWEVKDKQGNTYYFGRSDFNRSYGDLFMNNNRIFRWYLDGMKDINGNCFVILYLQGVPIWFKYTGYQPDSDEFDQNIPSNFYIMAHFEDQQREDLVPNYRSGGYQGVWARIKDIEICREKDGVVKKYAFEYKYSTKTNRSLLTKIMEYGSDGITSMPPVILTYQDNPPAEYDILSITGDPADGDNLWSCRFDANYDRGHDNYGSVPPPGFDVAWAYGPYTQASGSWSRGNWSIAPNGKLNYNSAKDAANWFWTYAFTKSAKTLNVPFSGTGFVWLNGDYSRDAGKVWNLKAGYNLIEITAYHQHEDFGFDLNYALADNVDLMNSTQVILPQLSCDFNADGLSDAGIFFASAGKVQVALSNGNGFLPKESWIDSFGVNQKLLLGDFNSDAKTDICVFDSTTGNWRIALSDGTKFVDDGVWLSGFGSGSGNQPQAGDFNGDGKTDICCFFKELGLWWCKIGINTGRGFEINEIYYPYVGADSGFPIMGDFNGDGLVDIGCFDYDSGSWAILLNDGAISNFRELEVISNFGVKKNLVVSDFNSDGLTDIGYFDEVAGKIIARISRGQSFAEPKEVPVQFSLKDTSVQVQSADYNGDGLTDFIAYNAGGNMELALSRGQIPDYLRKVENSLGGALELKYSSSSKFDNTGGDGQVDLPFSIPVLTESTVSDGQGNEYKTYYSYSGGLYDLQDKEFRGFALAKTIDAEGNNVQKYFKQDNIYKGQLYREETKDASGNLYLKTENTWRHTEPYSGVYFPYLAQTDHFIYDGDATYKQTRINFAYDPYGNPTRVEFQGDNSLTGDEKTQVREYAYNTGNWIISTPKHSYFLDQNQNKVSEIRFYYDTHLNSDDPPTRGLLTKEEAWQYNPLTRSETRIPTTYDYDIYGNLIRITDALGRSSTTKYETELNTYPIEAIDALGNIVKSTYNYNTGQVLTSLDANNQATANIYDSLARLIRVIGPNDSEEYPGEIYEYDFNTHPIKIVKKVKTDYSDSPGYLTTYQFFDGLGGITQTRAPAEDDPATGQARQIISNIVKFDPRGQIKEKYLPYFADASSVYTASSYATPRTTFVYDPIGRVIRTTNPDGTYTAVTYSDWINTITDENGHYKTEYFDAYGKIHKIEEHNSGQIYTTTYEYDALGNLVRAIDNQNNASRIWYDSLGRRIKMDDPDMGVWSYEYDSVGNLVRQTDAKAQVLTFSYDALNRLTAKLANGQVLASYYYDSGNYGIGRLFKITDQSGSSEFFYDNLGREIKSVKYISGSGAFTVERSYDALNRLENLKYPDGSIVKYEYNSQGIERVINSSPTSFDYISSINYAPTGQITKISYGNGAETTYAYNPQTLRLTNITTNSYHGKIQDLNYQFDNAGNIKSINDYVNTASQAFLYDDLNRLVQAQGNYGTFAYAYDSIGNMTRKDGVNLSYGRNGSLPHAVTQAGDRAIDYDANGNMIKKGGMELAYDSENRLSRVEDKETAQSTIITLSPGWNFISLPIRPSDTNISVVLSGIAGRYEQVSRYNAQTKAFESYVGNPKFDQFTDFDYGTGYQIYITGQSTVTLTISGTVPQSSSLALKSGYNLVACPRTGDENIGRTLTPLRLGEDYSKVLHYNKSTQGFEVYDASKQEFYYFKPGESYYICCLRDCLWGITNGGPGTQFYYDGDGGRVKKTGSTGTSTVYVGALYEVESGGFARKYIFTGPNRVCAVDSTGDKYFFHPDHLGSSNVVTDSVGYQAQHTEFIPYGSIFKNEGGDITKHKFTGKELDRSTGLYFYGARYYDPDIGRFITADTIVQAPYDPQSLNRYSYCRNNPLNYVDPIGHSWKSFWKSIFKPLISFVAAVATVFLMPSFAPLIAQYGFLNVAGTVGASAAGASAILNTGEGRKFVNGFGRVFFDNILGMPPGIANFFSSLVSYTALASGLYIGISSITMSSANVGVDYSKMENQSGEFAEYGKDVKIGKGGSSANFIKSTAVEKTSLSAKFNYAQQGLISSDIAFKGTPGAEQVFTALNIRHTAALVNVNGVLRDSAVDISFLAPLKGAIYAFPWTATCHQATFNTLMAGGMSAAGAFSATLSHGSSSYIISTSLYGINGGYGVSGIVNSEVDQE